MKKILISGGRGLIGSQLGKRLQEKGYKVALLSRSSHTHNSFPVFHWNPDKEEIDDKALDYAEYIIHLAGVNIGEKRWTPARKVQILDSRVKSGELIYNAIVKRKLKPKVFITASAIGYYGTVSSETIFGETDSASSDFLGRTCESWEEVANRFQETGIRSVKIRTGIMLSKEGGALSKLSLPIRYGIGAPIGSGKQYMPWIHIEDLCGIFIHALEHEQLTGAYNAVAPEHITNRDLTRRIARALRKPLWMPNIPSSFLRLLFGEMSVMLLQGSRISSEKIRAAGFSFQYPKIDPALQQLNFKQIRK